MDVRKFQQKDMKSLVYLWQRVFPDDPPHNEPTQVIAAKLAVDDLIFVAERGSIIIGACMGGYDGHRGWLYAVAVLPQARRSGVGKLLVTAAIEALKKLGCVKVNLQIRSTNKGVVAFYESLGFSEEDRISMGGLLLEQRT
jgi:ribosomal protein S18 acetylase RimI-like enzyme